MEKEIDRQRETVRALFVVEQQTPVSDDHFLARRQQINVVRLDFNLVLCKTDGHVGMSGKQLVHHAAEIWREMLNDDKRHSGFRRYVGEKLFERLETAGRSTNADHAEF